MTTQQIARRPPNGPPALPVGSPAPGDEGPNPLMALPKGMRKTSGFFFGMNAHLLKTPTVVVARVSYYAKKFALSPDELREVFARLSSPERQAKHEHAGVLLADLAREVNTVLGERQAKQQRQEAEAAEAEAAKLTPEEREKARQVMSEFRKNGFRLRPAD